MIRDLFFSTILVMLPPVFGPGRCPAHVPSLSPGGKEIVKKMYDRYAGKWYSTFAFDQKTEFYNHDSLQGTQTWHEITRNPDKFRIDFGEPDSGNALIIRGDSNYLFRNAKLDGKGKDDGQLTFLLGGMYFYPFDETIRKFSALGYDLDRSHEDRWLQKPVYVVGASKGDTTHNQLWIDQQGLYIVRMIRFEKKDKHEAIFGDQQIFGGGWSETTCSFYSNDHLQQKEFYYNCKPDVPLDDALFDPVVFIRGH